MMKQKPLPGGSGFCMEKTSPHGERPGYHLWYSLCVW